MPDPSWPDLPERIYLALTGPELDEISPAFLIESDLKRARWADVPTVEYVGLETIRERLLSDEAVIAATKRRHPLLSQYEPKHQETVLLNAKQELESAFAAAFKEDTEHGDQRRER